MLAIIVPHILTASKKPCPYKALLGQPYGEQTVLKSHYPSAGPRP